MCVCMYNKQVNKVLLIEVKTRNAVIHKHKL